jgi:hypothetical protein
MGHAGRDAEGGVERHAVTSEGDSVVSKLYSLELLIAVTNDPSGRARLLINGEVCTSHTVDPEMRALFSSLFRLGRGVIAETENWLKSQNTPAHES